ncbi:MAG: zinc-binding dehydrogenase [Planctomycetota bacterium]
MKTALVQETGRAAVFLGPGQPLQLQRLALPTPEQGEALVRIECCTICGSDLHTISGARKEPTPSILGHEILGRVERVGDPPPRDVNGSPLAPDDRITWSTSISCAKCDRCERGLPQKCRSLAKYGHEISAGRWALNGGLADYLLLRRGSAPLRVPEDLPAEILCPVNCATATITAAFRVAGGLAGRNVLIVGAGMLGITACAFAKSQGAAIVAACDVDARRLAFATKFGADSTAEWMADAVGLREKLLPHQADGFDVIVEVSGSPDAVESAVSFAGIGGHVVLVGSVKKSRPVAIDPEQVIRRWITIHGVHNYTPTDLRTAVDFLTRFGEQYPFATLVEKTYSLTEVNAAIEMASRSRPFRVAVRP